MWLDDGGGWLPVRLPVGLPGPSREPVECARPAEALATKEMQAAKPRSRWRNGRDPGHEPEPGREAAREAEHEPGHSEARADWCPAG
jgi:hypothetical protein